QQQTVFGVGQALLEELAAIGADIAPIVSKSGYWVVMLDPEATKLGFDRLARKNSVEVRLHSRLIGANVSDGRIHSVDIVDHSGIVTVEAGAFVDASGEATLATLAGVPLSQPGGSPSAVQPASMPIRIGGVKDGTIVDRKLMAELRSEHNKPAGLPILRAEGAARAPVP